MSNQHKSRDEASGGIPETSKSVAVIMPCLNEEVHLGRCLDSLLNNDYPSELLSFYIVDGMSTDRTREILTDYCRKHKSIHVLDNPKRQTPIALNIAIRAAKSDIILRVDAHSVYAVDYISTLVSGLDRHAADSGHRLWR